MERNCAKRKTKMSRQYPRVGEKRKLNKEKLCKLCGTKTKTAWHIQVNWFRGDDAVVVACKSHDKKDVIEYVYKPKDQKDTQ